MDLFMKFLPKILVVLIPLLVLQACVNHTELADNAYFKDDWDAAVENYSEALKKEKELPEINRLKQRLATSKHNGAETHMLAAQSSSRVGDIEKAYHHASVAYSYVPSEEAQRLLNDLKAPERDRLILLAQQRLDEKAWSESIALLESANKVDWSQKGSDLLVRAKRELAEYNAEMFNASVENGRNALKSKDWKQASHFLNTAMQYGASPQLEREVKFASLMFEAENYASQAAYNVNSSKLAEESFKKALQFGIDESYVKERLDEVELKDYEIVFHSAIIAPQKPDANTPWDGFDTKSGSASNLMSNLGGFFVGSGVIGNQLINYFASSAMQGMSAPDCFLIVSVDGQSYGGTNYTRSNDYRPVWDMSLKFRNINKLDNRVISLQVIDADESQHDSIGSTQFKLSDLVQTEGVHNKVLFNEKGELFAQGLLAVTVSSRRMK